MLHWTEIWIGNPEACAREYDSIMQVVMESLIGWDCKMVEQPHSGIFGEVLGWGDTKEEQVRLPFILRSIQEKQ
jgi:hypothetical protein